jgi:hypothetical protein
VAAGDVGGASAFIEQTMGRTIPVILGFMARLLGLGNIAGEIQTIIKRVQKPIQEAIGKLADSIAAKAKGVLARINGNPNQPGGKPTTPGGKPTAPPRPVPCCRCHQYRLYHL